MFVGSGLLEERVKLLSTGSLLCLRSLPKNNPLSVPLDLHPPDMAVRLGTGLFGQAYEELL